MSDCSGGHKERQLTRYETNQVVEDFRAKLARGTCKNVFDHVSTQREFTV